MQRDIGVLRHRHHGRDDVAQNGGGFDAFERQLELPRLDAGQIQHIGDQVQEMLSAAFDDVDIFGLPRRQRTGLTQLQHLAEADDGVQGRAELMAHAGEEVGLGVARKLGRLARLLQHRQVAFSIGHVHAQRDDAAIGHPPFDRLDRLVADMQQRDAFAGAESRHAALHPPFEIVLGVVNQTGFRHASENRLRRLANSQFALQRRVRDVTARIAENEPLLGVEHHDPAGKPFDRIAEALLRAPLLGHIAGRAPIAAEFPILVEDGDAADDDRTVPVSADIPVLEILKCNAAGAALRRIVLLIVRGLAHHVPKMPADEPLRRMAEGPLNRLGYPGELEVWVQFPEPVACRVRIVARPPRAQPQSTFERFAPAYLPRDVKAAQHERRDEESDDHGLADRVRTIFGERAHARRRDRDDRVRAGDGGLSDEHVRIVIGAASRDRLANFVRAERVLGQQDAIGAQQADLRPRFGGAAEGAGIERRRDRPGDDAVEDTGVVVRVDPDRLRENEKPGVHARRPDRRDRRRIVIPAPGVERRRAGQLQQQRVPRIRRREARAIGIGPEQRREKLRIVLRRT